MPEEKKGQFVEAVAFDVPPQIRDEHLMTPEEQAEAHAKVDAWYAEHEIRQEQKKMDAEKALATKEPVK